MYNAQITYDRIDEMAKLRGISIGKINEICSLSKNAISNAAKSEYGTAEPTFDAISKLADFYNVSVDFLLGREADKQSDYIQQLADAKGFDSTQRGILAAFCYMDDAGREKLIDAIKELDDHKKIRREQEQPVKQSTTLGTLEDQMEEAAKTKEEASS